MAESAHTLMSRLNMQVNGIITALDIDIIGRETSKTITRIRHIANDARLDIRDWEMADSRAEMDRYCKDARKRLEELRALMLKASEHGIFTAIEVMHLSTQIDAINEQLR